MLPGLIYFSTRLGSLKWQGSSSARCSSSGLYCTILRSDVGHSYRRNRCSRRRRLCKAVVEDVKLNDRTGLQWKPIRYNNSLRLNSAAESGTNEIQRVRRFLPRSEPVAAFPEVPLLSSPSFFEHSSQYQVGGRGFATFTQGRWNWGNTVSNASKRKEERRTHW
jgi:hypothetical protein